MSQVLTRVLDSRRWLACAAGGWQGVRAASLNRSHCRGHVCSHMHEPGADTQARLAPLVLLRTLPLRAWDDDGWDREREAEIVCTARPARRHTSVSPPAAPPLSRAGPPSSVLYLLDPEPELFALAVAHLNRNS